jgi:starvation-inducible outer membrane lipoprotein
VNKGVVAAVCGALVLSGCVTHPQQLMPLATQPVVPR